MTKNERNVTGTYSPQQVAADLFRIGENPNLPAWQYPVLQQAIGLLAAPVEQPAVAPNAWLDWAVERWEAEVKNRPLINVHRRTLDDTWRQVIRHCGGDDVSLLGPRHGDLLAANPVKTTERDPVFSIDDLDFEPDGQHAIADMANIGYALLEQIARMAPGYHWNDSPVEIVSDLVNERDEARASSANETSVEVFTYATKQATACASCGEQKHTPLRVDRMGGYVCLTCIDRELERSLDLASDQRAAVEFALGVCAGHVAGERHVSALESLLFVAQEAR
ncbi:gp38 [Burkholderia aenigmatica]|uniref:Gp38 n=1 Tax=Burkholderia aenigmatica TaxID=2015348 RepID=A0A6P2NJF2_9BURK|nr:MULTISPECIES: hypothetical protein [Burkholderia]VWB94757.1 gp38 [Burkholderia aenigmatica]